MLIRCLSVSPSVRLSLATAWRGRTACCLGVKLVTCQLLRCCMMSFCLLAQQACDITFALFPELPDCFIRLNGTPTYRYTGHRGGGDCSACSVCSDYSCCLVCSDSDSACRARVRGGRGAHRHSVLANTVFRVSAATCLYSVLPQSVALAKDKLLKNSLLS